VISQFFAVSNAAFEEIEHYFVVTFIF